MLKVGRPQPRLTFLPRRLLGVSHPLEPIFGPYSMPFGEHHNCLLMFACMTLSGFRPSSVLRALPVSSWLGMARYVALGAIQELPLPGNTAAARSAARSLSHSRRRLSQRA